MCAGMLNGPGLVNSRGDKLSDADQKFFSEKSFNLIDNKQFIKDPARRAEMLMNWLTNGGVPKKVEPGEIFKEAQDMAGVKSKAAAGAGIGGLFGFGNLIGEVQSIKPIKPLGTAPMKEGVPYSVTPIPNLIGSK